MSEKCPKYILSKIVTLLLAIITFIILSICMDSYKDYYKDRTTGNKNRWLKYQLSLFFCTGIIIYSFYKISSSRVEYTYTDGKKFSLGFFTLNLISMVAGATLSRGGEMLFYLMSVLSMMLSIYIFYTTMKEFISYNPEDSGNLLTGITGDVKKGFSTISGGISRIKGAMGRKKQQYMLLKNKQQQFKQTNKNSQSKNLKQQNMEIQLSNTRKQKINDSDVFSDTQSQRQGTQRQGSFQSQLKKGLHGLRPTQKSQNPSKHSRQMQQQFQKYRKQYSSQEQRPLQQFDYGDGRFGKIGK